MDHATQSLLGDINRRFYQTRAADWSATRDHPWPGWERLIEHSLAHGPDTQERGLQVLDVGCGNGRFGRFLMDRGVPTERYVGVDFSASLLEHARLSLCDSKGTTVELLEADLLASGPDAALPFGRFDLVVAFGLLHHVPGHAGRVTLLRAMARRLAKDGMLACTFWRFGAHERFESRVVPWDDFNRQNGGGLDTSQLERGDHLLAFGQSAEVPRYCHHSDDDEVDRLLDACELECFHRFEADGRSGDLNHYAVLRRES